MHALERVDASVRKLWPDAPRALTELVAARFVFLQILRRWNAAMATYDDATRAWVETSVRHDSTRLQRLEAASEAERAREALTSWEGILAAAMRLLAGRRDRFRALRAKHELPFARNGQPAPPVYVVPEERGDAYEPPPAEPPFRTEARAILRVWSRWYRMHAQH